MSPSGSAVLYMGFIQRAACAMHVGTTMAVIVIAVAFVWAIMLIAVAAQGMWRLTRFHKHTYMLPIHRSSNISGTVQTREVQMPLGYHDSFNACQDALKLLRRTTLQSMSRDEGQLTAKVGITFKEWGARILIELIPIEEHSTYVRVTIRPSKAWTLTDHGQNLEFIEIFVAALERRASGQLKLSAPDAKLLPHAT